MFFQFVYHAIITVSKIKKKHMDEIQKKQKNKRKYVSYAAAIAGIVLLFVAIGIAVYYHKQYKNVVTNKPESEIENIVKVISSVVDLPLGEVPTLATVTDKEKVKNQPFFNKAENGDKVLIYANSKKAYLFRPSTKRVIDMTTLSEETPQKQAEQTTAVSAPQNQQENNPTDQKDIKEQQVKATVAIYNGTTKKGITQTFEDFLEGKFASSEVVIKETAEKQDYEKTVVVDVSGKQGALVGEMAENLQAQIQGVPDGEAVPNSDILIILGADRL